MLGGVIPTKVHFTEKRTLGTRRPLPSPFLFLSLFLIRPRESRVHIKLRLPLHVQGGANLQRVERGVICSATVAHRGKRKIENVEKGEREEEEKRRGERLFSDDVFAYRPVYI